MTDLADVRGYNAAQVGVNKKLCGALFKEIRAGLKDAEFKIWHRHPVWFLDGNPIVGYAVRKNSVCLLFWSGQSFKSPGLLPEGSFKAAEAHYTNLDDVDTKAIARWLKEARVVQWDYKNIVKRRGKLVRIKTA